TLFRSWELSLANAYPPESTLPNKRGRQIRRLVKVHEAIGHTVNDSVLGWAQGGVLHHSGEGTPLDEFTNAEPLAIRDDCRNRIRAMEGRLAIGRRYLALGPDPRSEGCVPAGDHLCAVRYPGRAPQASSYADVIRACDAGVLHELSEDFASERATALGGGHRVMRRLMSYLYPSDTDLVAFRTLLQLETGAAPEEWSRVTLGDLE